MAATALLLDTDIGTDVDDAIALALLCGAPDVRVRAVTTVSGDTTLRARIAKTVLLLAGRTDVPCAAGARAPLDARHSFLWLGHEGRGILEDVGDAPLDARSGVDLLIDTVMRERCGVLAIGPLTNLAHAVTREPDLAGRIPRLTVMGGSLGLGAQTPPIEYNLCSDPEAALQVLTAGIPTTLVPADVTTRVWLTASHLDQLRRSTSRVAACLARAIEIWNPLQRAFWSTLPGFHPENVAFLHDPLTAAVLLDPTLVRIEAMHLRPVIRDGLLAFVSDPAAAALDVAVDVDAERFVAGLMRQLVALP